MALIKCTECGHEVSDKATSCPNCGCPIIGSEEKPPKKSKSKWVLAIVIVVTVVVVAVGCWFAFGDTLSKDDPDAIVELTPEFIEKVQQYDQLAPFSEGRAAVRRGDKWGYINTKGDEIIPCQYQSADDWLIGAEMFHEGLAQVYKGDSAYYINRKGDIVFEGHGGRFSEGLALLSDGRIVDTKGVTQFATKEVSYNYYFGGRFPFRTCYTQYPYYKNGKICVVVVSDDSNYEGEDICYDRLGNKIDDKGEEHLTANTKNDYTVFSDNIDYSEFRTGNNNGLKDKYGNIIIPAKYSEIGIPYPEVDADYNFINNGVVLLALRENDAYYCGLDDDGTRLRGSDGFVGEYTPRYYAFADLKGNTTFSEKVLSHIEEANEIGRERWETMIANQREIERRKQELREHPERRFNEMIGNYAWRGYLKERSLGKNCEEIVCFKKSDNFQGLAFYTLWVEGSNYQSHYRVYSGMGKYQIKGNVIELKVKNPDNSFVRSFQIAIGADDNVILESHDFINHSLSPIPFDIKLIPSNIQSFYR